MNIPEEKNSEHKWIWSFMLTLKGRVITLRSQVVDLRVVLYVLSVYWA
jgi:hypothetical protein